MAGIALKKAIPLRYLQAIDMAHIAARTGLVANTFRAEKRSEKILLAKLLRELTQDSEADLDTPLTGLAVFVDGDQPLVLFGLHRTGKQFFLTLTDLHGERYVQVTVPEFLDAYAISPFYAERNTYRSRGVVSFDDFFDGSGDDADDDEFPCDSMKIVKSKVVPTRACFSRSEAPRLAWKNVQLLGESPNVSEINMVSSNIEKLATAAGVGTESVWPGLLLRVKGRAVSLIDLTSIGAVCKDITGSKRTVIDFTENSPELTISKVVTPYTEEDTDEKLDEPCPTWLNVESLRVRAYLPTYMTAQEYTESIVLRSALAQCLDIDTENITPGLLVVDAITKDEYVLVDVDSERYLWACRGQFLSVTQEEADEMRGSIQLPRRVSCSWAKPEPEGAETAKKDREALKKVRDILALDRGELIDLYSADSDASTNSMRIAALRDALGSE